MVPPGVRLRPPVEATVPPEVRLPRPVEAAVPPEVRLPRPVEATVPLLVQPMLSPTVGMAPEEAQSTPEMCPAPRAQPDERAVGLRVA
jgi:hypothetical protein